MTFLLRKLKPVASLDSIILSPGEEIPGSIGSGAAVDDGWRPRRPRSHVSPERRCADERCLRSRSVEVHPGAKAKLHIPVRLPAGTDTVPSAIG
jgi:hypothetical protein